MSKVPVGHVHSHVVTIKVILEHQKKYNVLCSQATINCVMAYHAMGLIISGDFKGGGWPPICSDTDLKRIAESLDEEVGKTYDKSDVNTMIKKMQTNKLEQAGYTNIIEQSICDSAVRNFSALLADEGNVAISQSYNNVKHSLCC